MKPFLKWAGNKYKSIERIKSVLPKGKRLIEPFLGTGAVFLNTDYPHYLLTDNNPDLILLYQRLQKEGQQFINKSREFFTPENNTPENYYELRELFNVTRSPELFIYLNKHCFNGLCRYNSKNKFNTPFGQYKQPYFPEKEMQFFYEKSQQAVFEKADFADVMNSAESSDVVYCDPPYVPISKTAKFTSYSVGEFGEAQQLLLAETAQILRARGITVVISNHDTEFTRQAYQHAKIAEFDVQRFISCKGKERNKVGEILAVFE